MPKHYKTIIDIIKADQLSLFPEENEKILAEAKEREEKEAEFKKLDEAGIAPLDKDAKYGDVKRAIWDNKLNDDDYVDILMGRFKNFDLDDALRMKWADPDNKESKMEDQLQGFEHFLKLKNNNPKVNDDLLRQVSQKINKASAGGATSSERSHARALRYTLEYLTNHSNISEKAMESHLNGAYYPKNTHSNRMAVINNPNFTKKLMHKAIESNPKYLQEFMREDMLDKTDENRYLTDPKYLESVDLHRLGQYIGKKMRGSVSEDWQDVGPEGVPQNIAHAILNSNHVHNISNDHMDHILGQIGDSERKRFIDSTLGIEGGSHYEEKGSLSDDEWENTNWDNWNNGEGYKPNLQRYLAGSKWLDDDQAEHIKRHGDFDAKFELYHNASVDKKHGAEMFRKWHDDDEHHGYDARDLIDHHKTWNEDVYDKDDLDPALLDEVRENIENDDDGSLREGVEQSYTFSDWAYENSEDLSKKVSDEDYIDEIHERMYDDHDWEGDNPNYNEYFDSLIEDIANAAEDDNEEDEEGNFVDHSDGMVRKKHWQQFLPEMRQNVPKELVNEFEEFVAHNLNDDDDEMDADTFRSYFQEDIDGINPRRIDFSSHDDFSISEHPEYEERYTSTRNDHMDDIIRERPYDFWEDFYEDYYDSDTYRERLTEAQDEAFDEALEEHYQDLYEDSHQDHRFIPEHLREHLPEYEQLKNKVKSRKNDGGHGRFLDGPIKQREYEHSYGDDQHLHEMVKDYAEANGGSIDMGKMIKLFPNLKDSIKKVFSGQGKLSSDQIQQKIDSIPKTNYAISYGQWAKGKMQNLNNQDQVLIRLDHSDESMKPITENPDLYNTFKKVQNVSRQSGHPTKDNTIAWARVDMSDPEHWMIDELQSDFGKTVTRYLKDQGHDDKAEHIKTISDLHKNWREALINHVIKEAKKHGVKKVSTHSPESKHKHAGYGNKNIHSVYKDGYKKVPRKMGFKEASFRDLPLTDTGKKYFDDGKTEAFDKKLEGHQEAYDHHVGYAAHHYDAASKFEEGSIENRHHSNLYEKHLDYAHAHNNVLNTMGNKNPQDKSVLVDISNHELNDEIASQIDSRKLVPSDSGFNAHAHDDEIDSEIVQNSKGLSGHTYEIQPQLLKKHIEIIDYIEALEKGEIKQAVKGIALSTMLLNAAHFMGKPDEKPTPTQTYQNARTVAAKEIKRDPAVEAYEEAKKDADDIIKRNQKRWFMENKATSLSPIVYKQTIKGNEGLNERYGHTLNYSNKTFREAIEKNPHLRHDIHAEHYEKLHNEFDGNLDKIQHAWENGIKATHKKFNNEPEVNHTDKRIRKDEQEIGPQLNTTGQKPNKIRQVADAYAQQKGMTLNHDLPKAKVNPAHAAKIAKEYHGAQHDPSHPEVQQAYDALIKETSDQFNHIVNTTGLKISKITPDMKNPYANSKELFKDLHENNHLWFYPTEIGYGSGDGDQGIEHPMLQATDIHHEGQPLLANDLFRIVHDYFGHAKEGNGFGANGEENAWLHHKQMYSPLAAKALTAETKMQNSWVNYGPHGEHNRKNPANTIYADQKATLAPDWVVNHMHPETMEKSEDLMKGSLQRRNKFNPMSTANQIVRDEQRHWTHDEYEGAKYGLKGMNKFARLRALNKLAGKTKVSKHPETGERMFLMHRGTGEDEFLNHSDDVKLYYDEGHRNSWTPDEVVAREFAQEGDHVMSAWIPESKLLHSVNQFNTPSKMGIEATRKDSSKKQDEYAKGRSVTENEEHEWIVHHDNSPIYHANPEAMAYNTIHDKINRRGIQNKINKAEDDKNKGLKEVIHEQQMYAESGRPMPLDDVDDSHDPHAKKEDKKVKDVMTQLKTDTPNPSKMFQRVYSVPSEEKMNRAKKAKKSGQIPNSVNVYGSHFPVVKLLNDNTLLLHTSDYGKKGKTKEIVDKIRKELPEQFPDFKVIEVHHPDYKHSSKVMRLRNRNGLKKFLTEASTNHPDEDYRNHALEALEHLNSVKKGEYTKPIHAKRTEAEGWDGDKNMEIRMNRINTYLKSVGLTPDGSAGKKRDLGATSPTSVNINMEGDPEDQQMLHEGAHAMLTPEGVTLEEYQAGIGEPGFKGKLHQTKHRQALKESHGGGMPEQTAQQMEGMIARRAGVEPFRSPQRGASDKSEVERSRQHAQKQMKMFDEGIYSFDPFTGENELQGTINAYINAKKMGDKDLAEKVRQKLLVNIRNKKKYKEMGYDEADLMASEYIISNLWS